MSTLIVLLELVVLLSSAGVVRGEVVPAVMIDYERHHPGGLAPVPDGLLPFVPRTVTDPKLSWVVVSREDVVRVALIDASVNLVKFELPHLDVYRLAVGDHPELALGPETIRILRDRQREIALEPAQPLLFADQRVRDTFENEDDALVLRARFVERPREGGARVHLAGPGFARVVDFADLDDFNRASGLNLTANDFWRETLFFWWEGAHEMSGGFVMKTPAESRGDCGRILL